MDSGELRKWPFVEMVTDAGTYVAQAGLGIGQIKASHFHHISTQNVLLHELAIYTNMDHKPYRIDTYLASEADKDCELTVRTNGKIIYIRYCPDRFQNSPAALARYLSCLEAILSDEVGEVD
jgi:hypothetical protein